MKTLVVTIVLRDEQEVESASKDVAESIAQHWAMFSWDIREATQGEVEWYTGEYEEEES